VIAPAGGRCLVTRQGRDRRDHEAGRAVDPSRSAPHLRLGHGRARRRVADN
jgi:hypothetical protein